MKLAFYWCTLIKQGKMEWWLNVQQVRFATAICHHRATLYVCSVITIVRCPSVPLTHLCIVAKRLNVSSVFFLNVVAPSFYFLEAIRYYPISKGQGHEIHGEGKGNFLYKCVTWFVNRSWVSCFDIVFVLFFRLLVSLELVGLNLNIHSSLSAPYWWSDWLCLLM